MSGFSFCLERVMALKVLEEPVPKWVINIFNRLPLLLGIWMLIESFRGHGSWGLLISYLLYCILFEVARKKR